MKHYFHQAWFVIFALAIFWDIGLAADTIPDYWPTHGWNTASPESQGVESDRLAKMLETLWEKKIEIDSLLIIRNGYLVLEAYNNPFDSDTRHNLHSCTKSICSALVGIGIDKGYIKDLHKPVLDFFPNLVVKNFDARKKTMTLENLLTMTTGLECRDSYLYQWRGLDQMKKSHDWIQFMMDLPMADVPGTRFEYCNGASFLLSAILQKQTGITAALFAEKHLFGPLGITNFRWPSNSQGITLGYGQLQMRPRDAAKIGYLYLKNGVWDGKQIISSQWIKASTRKHADATIIPGYGYQWWILNPDIYTAVGYQGQFIVVAPEKNLVAVFTGSLVQEDFYIPLGLLAAYIMPAAASQTPLPENSAGQKALDDKIVRWQETSHVDREKRNIISEKFPQELTFETYVNKAHGFSVKYDAQLLNMDHELVSPVIFRRRGLRGMPVFAVLTEDIPRKMALENTGEYMIDFYKRMLKITDAKI